MAFLNISSLRSWAASLLPIIVLIIFVAVLESSIGWKFALFAFFLWALGLPLLNYMLYPQLREVVNNNMLFIVEQLELMVWGEIKDGNRRKENTDTEIVNGCKTFKTNAKERDAALQQNVQKVSDRKSKRTKNKSKIPTKKRRPM